MNRQLVEFNYIYREIDQVYHNAAKEYGISDSMFWILYVLREKGSCIQSEICEMGAVSKQTVNSALKKMEIDGLIQLRTMAENRRNKEVLLTRKGEELTNRTIDQVIQAENQTFARMTEEESQMFLQLSRKYYRYLQEEIAECYGEREERTEREERKDRKEREGAKE